MSTWVASYNAANMGEATQPGSYGERAPRTSLGTFHLSKSVMEVLQVASARLQFGAEGGIHPREAQGSLLKTAVTPLLCNGALKLKLS